MQHTIEVTFETDIESEAGAPLDLATMIATMSVYMVDNVAVHLNNLLVKI